MISMKLYVRPAHDRWDADIGAAELVTGDAFGREVFSECLVAGCRGAAHSYERSRESKRSQKKTRSRTTHCYSTLGAFPASGVTSSTRARPVTLASVERQFCMHGFLRQNDFSVTSRSSS